MKKYTISFTGRHAGAIGKFHKIRAVVYASSDSDAIKKLYEKYDHISMPRKLKGGRMVPMDTRINPRRKRRSYRRNSARKHIIRSLKRYSRKTRRNTGSRMWTYKGVDVFPADRNSSGIRWYARDYRASGVLRSDTRNGMKSLINDLPKKRS
jgi:hypothetical protein